MSEHFFGLGAGRVPSVVMTAVDRIAGQHDARIVRYDDPASGWRFWMACPNRGAPFDGATSRAVMTDLESAGLWPPTSDLARTVAECLHDHDPARTAGESHE